VVLLASTTGYLFDGHALDPVTVMRAWRARLRDRFDLEAFYSEAAWVLRPGGCLATWCYGLYSFDTGLADRDAAANATLMKFYEGKLGAYWDPQRRLVEERYAGEEQLPWHRGGGMWSLSFFVACLVDRPCVCRSFCLIFSMACPLLRLM
jgi:hypothetical protein